MDKAKAAMSSFMHKSGHHDTTVHETVAPAVQHETVKRHQHEDVNTVIDKEVHQDHYHRTVQPVADREVLPEEHKHNMAAVEHREFDHRDHDTIQRNLAAEQAQFKDDRVVHDTTHSQEVKPALQGEHVHHHLHETIQPVIHKETIQPSVVHTTVPIHETHHSKAQHHSVSELPPVSLADFKAKGGVLGGREERYDGFEGEPKNIGGILDGVKHHKHDSGNVDGRPLSNAQHGDYHPLDGQGGHHTSSRTGAGVGAAGAAAGAGIAGHEHQRGAGRTRRGSNSSSSDDGVSRRTGQAKPSMMDKLNPKVDANGDGKAGFMK